MKEGTRTTIKDILLLSGLGILLYWAIHKFFFLLFPLFAAFLLSQGIRSSLEKIRPLSPTVKKILTVLFLLIFFALISLATVLLIERILHYATSLADFLSHNTDKIFSFFNDKIHDAEAFFVRFLHRDMENKIISFLPEMLRSFSQKLLTELPGWIADFVNLIPKFFVSLIIFMLSTYYFSCDWYRFSRFFGKHISKSHLDALCRGKHALLYGLKQYVKAYLLLFLLSFAQLFFGFVVLRVSGTIPLAFLIALLDLLPVIGCGTFLIPWGIFALTCGNGRLGIGLFILFGIITVVRQIAEPKIVGSSIGLHPVVSLLLVIIGLSFFGFTGMIFLPLIVTCLVQGQNNTDIKKEQISI